MVDPPARASAESRAQESLDSKSFSQFFARVLDQLSLSAWLPAAFLVGVVTVATVASTSASCPDDSNRLSCALSDLGDLGIAGVVLILGSIVVATVFTQAFGFSSIRLLEGYWGTTRPANVLAGYLCRFHIARRRRFVAARKKADDQAVQSAVAGMRSSCLELEVMHQGERELVSRGGRGPFGESLFREHANPRYVQRTNNLSEYLRSTYPTENHRVMPTVFGNALRVGEDALELDSGEELRTWVIERFSQLPTSVQHEHDQYRRRLDLYSMMTLSMPTAAALAFAVLRLGPTTPDWKLFAAAGFLGGFLSHKAALRSARLYSDVLRVVKRTYDWTVSGGASPASPGASDT